MKEVLSSYKQFVTERLSTPFFANLVFSWLIFNWEIVYLTVFIDEKTIYPVSKIDYIRNHYLDSDHLYWFPLFSTLAITIVLPAVNVLIFAWREYMRTLKRNWGINIKKGGLITPTEYWELHESLKLVEKRYQESINSYQGKVAEITQLKIGNDRETTKSQELQAKYFEEKEQHKKEIAQYSLSDMEAISNIRLEVMHQNSIESNYLFQLKANRLYLEGKDAGIVDMIQNDNYTKIAFRVTKMEEGKFPVMHIYLLSKESNVEFSGSRINLLNGNVINIRLSY